MIASIELVITKTSETSTNEGYVIGAIIALLILGYLLYALINPEKF